MGETLYLIEKCGLYYKPGSMGYTGIRDLAGRYSLEDVAVQFPNRDSAQQDGITFVALEDADEFSPACCWDIKLRHLSAERDRHKTAGQRCRNRINALEAELRRLDPGNQLVTMGGPELMALLGYVADQIEPSA